MYIILKIIVFFSMLFNVFITDIDLCPKEIKLILTIDTLF